MQLSYFVIHLKRAEAREPNVQVLKSILPGTVSVIDAVDGTLIGDDQINQVYVPGLHKPKYPFSLRNTEIACFLSHRKAWKAIAEGSECAGFVIEDDAAVDSIIFNNAFSLIQLHVDENAFIRFPIKEREKAIKMLGSSESIHHFVPKIVGLGMVGLLIGKKTALRLLAATEQFDRPVDTFIQLYWESGVRPTTVYPSGMSEISNLMGGSVIGTGRKKSFWKTLYREIRRTVYRVQIFMLSILKSLT
jgi:GR25 family glycosyltransferase involved in LPS biosynthesis